MSLADRLLREYFKALDDSADPTIVGSTCELIRREAACRDYLALPDRLRDEADLCRNEGASDIAILLDEAASAIAPKPNELMTILPACAALSRGEDGGTGK